MSSSSLFAAIATLATMGTAQSSYPQPVLPMPYAPGIMDATLKHLCLYSKGANSFNLSYSDYRRNEEACVSGNSKSCCGTTSSHFVNGRSCHQSPFAITYESGQFGSACVSAYENAFQGWWLGQWRREITGSRSTAFGENQPILVNVEGLDCASVKEADLVGANVEEDPITICGSDNPSRTLANGVEKRVIPPSIAKNTYHDDYSLVIVPFGDLSPAGEYTLEATIKGEAFDVRLWDNVGQDLVVGAITPDAQNKIKLNFKGPRVGVGLMVATPDTDAEVSWELSGTGGGSSGGDDGQLTTKTLSVSQTTNLISFFPSSTPASNTADAAAGGTTQEGAVPGGSGTAGASPSVVLSNDGRYGVDGPSFWQRAMSGMGAGLMALMAWL